MPRLSCSRCQDTGAIFERIIGAMPRSHKIEHYIIIYSCKDGSCAAHRTFDNDEEAAMTVAPYLWGKLTNHGHIYYLVPKLCMAQWLSYNA